MTNPILELNDICYSYHSPKGETDALSHISFQIKKENSWQSSALPAAVNPRFCLSSPV